MSASAVLKIEACSKAVVVPRDALLEVLLVYVFSERFLENRLIFIVPRTLL